MNNGAKLADEDLHLPGLEAGKVHLAMNPMSLPTAEEKTQRQTYQDAPNQGRIWTEKEWAYVDAHYHGTHEQAVAVAKVLGRTPNSVVVMASRMRAGRNQVPQPAPLLPLSARQEVLNNPAYAEFYEQIRRDHGVEAAEQYLAITVARRSGAKSTPEEGHDGNEYPCFPCPSPAQGLGAG